MASWARVAGKNVPPRPATPPTIDKTDTQSQSAAPTPTQPQGTANTTAIPIQQPDSTVPDAIFFHCEFKPWGFMSQWFLSDMTDPDSGKTFNCCEQWMMWNKAKSCGDKKAMNKVMACKAPGQQKSLGRLVEGFSDKEWDRVKYDIVVRGNYLKFSQGYFDMTKKTTLKELLLKTGNAEIAEASPSDRVWGIGVDPTYAPSTPRNQWGQNLLGKALMQVREQLREEEASKTKLAAASIVRPPRDGRTE